MLWLYFLLAQNCELNQNCSLHLTSNLQLLNILLMRQFRGTLRQKLSHARKFMEKHEHNSSVAFMLITERTALKIIGNDSEASAIEGINLRVSQQHEMYL